MLTQENTIRNYLEEGLVALLPHYGGEGRAGTRIFTLEQTHESKQSLPWLVELLARYSCLDLKSVRRRSGQLLGLRHHIPLPLSEGLVLLPVKVRQGDALGEKTAGYVNLLHIARVEGSANGDDGEGPEPGVASGAAKRYGGDGENCRSSIVCNGGIVIHCRNTAATVKGKLRQGEILRDEVTGRQKVLAAPGTTHPGLDGNVLKELLPSCDCLLRNIVLLLLK